MHPTAVNQHWDKFGSWTQTDRIIFADTNVKPFKCFTCHMSFARRLVFHSVDSAFVGHCRLTNCPEICSSDTTQFTVETQTTKKASRQMPA